MDQLRDNIGKGVLPAVVAVTEKLSAFAGFMAEHETLAKGLVIALGGLAGALLAVSVASTIATIALSPILLPVAAAVVGIAALSFVVYKLVSDFRANWPLLLPIVLGPLGAIIAACIHWHSQIAGVFTAAWNAVKNVTSAAWGAISSVVSVGAGAAAAAMGALVTAAGAVRSAFNAVRSAAEAVAGFVRGDLAGAFNAFKGVASGVVHVANAIAAAFWAAEHAVQALINAINSIPTPHLPHISLPHIPGTAAGGIVRSPQIRLVGEAGPEAIVPLSRGLSGIGGGGGINVTVHVHGALMGSSVPEVAATIRSELLRTQRRNGGLGFAT
jgi:phage-related minor tail protein